MLEPLNLASSIFSFCSAAVSLASFRPACFGAATRSGRRRASALGTVKETNGPIEPFDERGRSNDIPVQLSQS